MSGEWIEMGSATDLRAFVVQTPDGLVAAADLAGDENPETIATLRGEGIEMICVCIAAPDSECSVRCVDSRGNRWIDHPIPEELRGSNGRVLQREGARR